MTDLGQPISRDRAIQLNPIVLAFVGDAVYTLLVRRSLALESGAKAGELNRRASMIVSAHGQSERAEKILPLLDEDEESVYRRGRNAKKTTKSKSASSAEYSRSTGLEAVIGFLYLTGRIERIFELFFKEEL